MKPRVSLLMPSRERSELARKSAESLGNGRWELLIAIDKDDPELKEYQKLKSPKIKLLMFDRHGYEGLWHYYNALAEQARGDWIMLWNDDAIMEPGDWIDHITQYNHQKPMVLNPYHPTDNLFPIISRAWYKLIGHFALSTHVDSWAQAVGVESNTQVQIMGVSIKHEGEDLNDVTHRRVREVVKDTSEHHRSDAMQTKRSEEARMIVEQLLKGGYRIEDHN